MMRWRLHSERGPIILQRWCGSMWSGRWHIKH